jgi:hypothetical protein
MNFKKPSSNKLTDHASMFGGAVAGSMVSRGLISAMHKPTAGADAALTKKEDQMLLIKRAGLIVVSGYAGAGIDGNDVMSTLIKGALIGVATMQTIDLVKDLAAKDPKLSDTSTPAKKMVARSLGLGCGCSEATPVMDLGMGRPRRRSLRMPEIQNYNFAPVVELNALDQAVQSGALAS